MWSGRTQISHRFRLNVSNNLDGSWLRVLLTETLWQRAIRSELAIRLTTKLATRLRIGEWGRGNLVW